LSYLFIYYLDISTRLAKFPLKFLQGTKKAPVYLKFSMQVEYAGSGQLSSIGNFDF